MSKKGGEGGVIANPKNFIANLRILTNFLEKKRNVFSKKGRGGQGRLEIFQKTSIFESTVTISIRDPRDILRLLFDIYLANYAVQIAAICTKVNR